MARRMSVSDKKSAAGSIGIRSGPWYDGVIQSERGDFAMLRGTKALVTGGTRGIGFAIAGKLAENGCRVVITGRKEETLAEAVRQLPGTVIPMAWDTANVEQARQRVDEAARLLGGLDILVNNAGLFAQNNEWDPEQLLRTTPEQWETVVRVNETGLFFAMQAGVGWMLDHQVPGNILNIASVAAWEPAYGAYGASKTAAAALTRGWGKLFAPRGIVINGIAPGPVATAMNGWKEGDSLRHDRIPAGRFATAQEVAELAWYLLSREASMICGETVTMDGAYAIR